MNVLAADEQESVDIVIGAIKKYVSSKSVTCDVALELFAFLLYSPFMVTTEGVAQGHSYTWRFYDNGVWSSIDRSQVTNMLCVRIPESRLHEALNVGHVKLERSLERMLRSNTFNTLQSRLYYGHFESSCNNKDKVFVTGTWSYDVQLLVVRRGLPSDIATLRSDRVINIAKWSARKDDMYAEMSTWLPDVEVQRFYLDVLASAIGEYPQRYALVNSGTGSDGKSTFTHIVEGVFGSYCYSCPSKGPTLDTSNSNDATPLANSLMGRRVCITADVKDVGGLLSSPSFKSMSGGDTMYTRALHREARQQQQTMVMLCIVNTNQVKCSVSNLAEMTRIRVVNFSRKMMNSNDMGIVPSHQLKGYKDGKSFYHKVFLSEYGDVLLTELILRHTYMNNNAVSVTRCDLVIEWTRFFITPSTILSFINSCTEPIASTGNDNTQELEEEELLALRNMMVSEKDLLAIKKVSHNRREGRVNLLDLFLVYNTWRRNYRKIESSDPVVYSKFCEHIAFHFEVTTEIEEGVDVNYIKGVKVKQSEEVAAQAYGGRHYMTRRAIMNNFGTRVNKEDEEYVSTF
jgi:hypothetical protein